MTTKQTQATQAVQVDSFSVVLGAIQTRVEPVTVDIDGTEYVFWVREMNGSVTDQLQRRAPNTVASKDANGKAVTTTVSETSKLGMALVLRYSVVTASDHTKPLMGGAQGEKEWNKLPSRYLKPLFAKALEISDLGDSEEEVGNDEENS
jgi:hypothetical protein